MTRSHLILLATATTLLVAMTGRTQTALDSLLPVRGLCISAPNVANVDEFVAFIRKELVPRKVNTLVLRVDYNYQYTSHPELRDSIALSGSDVKKIVLACREGKIRVIPQINLLGHQSWASTVTGLLRVYPQFDETPHVQMPAEYKWPNPDGLYCKSYCPLHPDVHQIVFDLIDEIVDAFETDAFHAGMDEVFYIGDDRCPRCGGRDKAELFAGEVTTIRNHLAARNRELWIWGDRLIDGKSTGIGMWEASMNNTHRAIDLIPKDVVINDWHYELAVPTAAYFAMKGLRVVTCPWRRPAVAKEQLAWTIATQRNSPKEMKPKYYGMMQTVWTSAKSFMDSFYGKTQATNGRPSDRQGEVESFRLLFDDIAKLK